MEILRKEYLTDSEGHVYLFKLSNHEFNTLNSEPGPDLEGPYAVTWSDGGFENAQQLFEHNYVVIFFETIDEAQKYFNSYF